MEDIVETIVESVITTISKKQDAAIQPVECIIKVNRNTYGRNSQQYYIDIRRVNVANRDMWQLKYTVRSSCKYRMLFDQIEDALEYMYYSINHEWYGIFLYMLYNEKSKYDNDNENQLMCVKMTESDVDKSFKESSIWPKLMYMGKLMKQVRVNTSDYEHDY